ncbi:transporter substrate-binding domain-containing protein [Bacillota bacterium LX-D]|nr:transporter substrate-binding domain-containing protein [Bacillota bacterium LX-D]
MKKIKYLLGSVLLLSLVIFGGCGAQKQATTSDNNNDNAAEKTALQLVQEKGELVAGLDDTFAPMGYHDEKTNDLVGFDIDMGAELAKRLGVKMKWQPTDWKGVTGSLNAKKFDVIISGMSVTPEREKVIAFSKPYLHAGIGMVVKKS